MVSNPIQSLLEELHARLQSLDEGDVATYIPELGRADPAHFAIALTTADGYTYCVGDARVEFTIQSISKPFVYGLALEDQGVDTVLTRVGVEPSGEAFNAISLEPGTGRPRNAMINAGAIAANSLVAGPSTEAKLDRIVEVLSRCAGRPLAIDDDVFRSEEETGHRNRAIGHLLRNAGILDGNVDEVVRRYFRQCSVLVNCADLSIMAATLANRGTNPRTGVPVLSADNVERVLSVMSTAGMYDFAGSWAFRVGMPAKSGVAGGVIAALPGQLGLGVFSPRLDPFGNSVRGVAVCEALSRDLALHLLRPPVSPASVMRTRLTLEEVSSKRRRSPALVQAVEAHGGSVRIYELQGPLVLSTAELVLRHAHNDSEASIVVFDCRRVTSFDPSVATLFARLAKQRMDDDRHTLFAGVRGSSPWARQVAAEAGHGERAALEFFADLDLALRWCESEVLRSAGPGEQSTIELPLRCHPLTADLEPDAVEILERAGERQFFLSASRIITEGDPADALFLVLSGSVNVSIALPDGRQHLLAILGPGSVFGEMALLDQRTRSASVAAETDVSCFVLPLAALRECEEAAPHLGIGLMRNIARDLADRLRLANAHLRALAS